MPLITINSSPFGTMVVQSISALTKAIEDIHRANLAATQAQVGIDNPGAALEGQPFGVVPAPQPAGPVVVNGVATQPASTTGQNGAAFAAALSAIDAALQGFLQANIQQLTLLDQGK